MDDVALMAVIESLKDTAHRHHRILLRIYSFRLQQLEQLSPLQVLEDEVDVEVVFVDLVELDDFGVGNTAHDVDFSMQRHQALVVDHDLAFFDGFDGVQGFVVLPFGEVHLGLLRVRSTLAKLPLPMSLPKL
jgi:hypothetical protein